MDEPEHTATAKRKMVTSWFDGVEVSPLPPSLERFEVYLRDQDPEKVNLIFGSYHDDEGKTIPLPVVKEVEKLIVNDPKDTYDYLSAAGLESFARLAAEVIMGANHPVIRENRLASIQTISGTNALYFAARFLSTTPTVVNTVYLAEETWGNHAYVFRYGGVENIKYYRYCDYGTMGLDLEGMLEDLRTADPGSIVLLQPCSHNPTGVDPSRDQWSKIMKTIEEQKLFPVWDCAFHGFVSGDPHKDTWPVRYFAEHDVEFMVAQTFSKIFCLDTHRPGNLLVVTKTPERAVAVKSQLTAWARSVYNNPPSHGARIISIILSNPECKGRWISSVQEMVMRMKRVRKMLRQCVELQGAPGSWKHITEQHGLFCFTGLTEEQTDYLATEHHVYMQKNGRMNICGINEANVTRVARALVTAIKLHPSTEMS